MDLHVLLYSLYLFCGVVGSLMLIRKPPKSLLVWSIVFIAYSSLPTLEMAQSANKAMSLTGQSLMIFFSIIGGALFSSAWGELRRNARENN